MTWAYIFIFMSLLFADTTKLRVIGQIPKSVVLMAEDLAKLPRTTSTQSRGTKWEQIYDGVTLRDLLIHAGVPTSEFLNADSRKTVRVTNSEGAWTAFYLVELERLPLPILAFRVNGQPLPGNTFELISGANGMGNISVSPISASTIMTAHIVVCIEVSHNARSSWHN